MQRALTIIALLLACQGNCQNMVPNPSFETFTVAPTTYGQIANATPWVSAYGSADLFHTSAGAASVGVPANWFGTQAAHTGNAYAGIAWSNTNSYHEYMRVQLTGALTVGQVYYCEAYVSAGEGAYRYGVNNFGFLLTTTAPTAVAGDPPINMTPQVNWTTPITDYTNWTLVSGTFTATSAAQYLTLGSFYSVAATTWTLLGTAGSINSQYWYIDDVVVQPNIVLPSSIVMLKVEPSQRSQVKATWEAPASNVVERFVLERSSDGGTSWVVGGVIQPEMGKTHYEQLDTPGLYQTDLLYRVKEVGNDGTVLRSAPVSIRLEAPSLETSAMVFPNPSVASEGITLQWAQNTPSTAILSVLSLTGEILWSAQVDGLQGVMEYPLPTNLFQPGTYLVRIESEGQTCIRKFSINP